MKQSFLRCFKLLLVMVLGGCGGPQSNCTLEVQEVNPWTHLAFKNDPGNFQFAIIGDHAGGHRPGVFADAVGKLNLLQPEFVLCVGDLIEGYTEDEAALDRMWDEFDGMADQLQMPFFYLPGNHDDTNETMLRKWQQRFGRTYYHFVYQDVLFLFLNSEDPPRGHESSNFSPEQLDYFRAVLKQNTGNRWTMIFLHKPMWETEHPAWLEFEKMVADRNYTVFAGHAHAYALTHRLDKKYIRLGVTGGILPAPVPESELPDAITWVTMTDQGPILANILLRGILDEETPPPVTAGPK